MTDLVLGARLDADSGKLVGQLSRAEAAARGLEGELENLGSAAAQLRSRIDPMYTAQQRFDRELSTADRLLKAGVISTREYAAANSLARTNLRNHSEALHGLTNAQGVAGRSARASAAGYQQLGFQMQDVFQQAALGINPLVILAQQGGQTASAIALMGDRADGTKGRFIRFATFLSGPWGAALFGAATIVGFLVQGMLEASDAAEEAEDSSFNFADGLNVLVLSADKASAAMRQLVQELQSAIAMQGDFLRSNAQVANQSVTSLESRLDSARAELKRLQGQNSVIPLFSQLSGQDRLRMGTLKKQIAGDQASLAGARQAAALASLAVSQRNVQEARDPNQASINRIDEEIGRLNTRRRQTVVADDPLAAATGGVVISQKEYEAELGRLTGLREAAEEAQRKAGRDSTGKRAGAGAADKLARFGDSAGERVQRVFEQYDPSPRGIDKPLQDLRALDRIMAELEKRKPPGFEATIASAEEARKAVLAGLSEPIDAIAESFSDIPRGVTEAQLALSDLDAIASRLAEANPPDLTQLLAQIDQAKATVQESLVRPFKELREDSERRQQIDLLILAGREDEARVLEEIWRLEEQLGPLTEDRREEVEAIVLAEEEHLRRLERAQELQSAYLGTTRSVRGELEAIFAGRGDFGNFKQIFRDLKARVMVEQIFGPALQEFDDYVKENTAIDRAVDDFAGETHRAGDAAGTFADALVAQATRIANPANAIAGRSTFDQAFADLAQPAPEEGAYQSVINVVGDRDAVREGIEGTDSVLAMTPERYFEQLTKRMVSPLLEELDGLFGVEFFGQLQGALAGFAYGSATGGKVGGFLGLGKGLVDQFGSDLFGEKLSGIISGKLGSALGGAQTGTQIAGFADMLGIDLSNSGSQIGGAIGSFVPIPGGEIIGSIAGGIIGKIIGGAKRGSAIVTGVDNGLGTYGDSSSRKEAALGLGGSIQEGLARIADSLQAEIGAFKVSIGIRNDSFRVDPQGRGYTKTSKYRDIKDFGTDEAGAIAYAIADAIGDGAIKGISEKVQQALGSSPDIEKAVEEALKVREIEELLSGIEDSYSEELRSFERTAEERLRIGRKYGFDLVELERINAEERADLIDGILTDRVGSLRDLLEDLSFGDLAEGTLAEQRQKILEQIAEAEADAEAGKDGAADRLASLNRQLVELSRQAYGTAGGEYGADRDRAISSAERIIELEEERLRQERAEVTDRLDRGIDIANETNDILAAIRTGVDRLGTGGGFGGGRALDTTRAVAQ